MPDAIAKEIRLKQADALQTIIDFLPSGVTLFDPDLQMIACNEQFRRLLDFPAAMFKGGLPTMYDLAIFNASRGDYGPGDREVLAQQVVDVVWKVDRDFRFTYISPADERLRGYRADEVIGHHVFEMFTAAGVAVVTEKLQQRRQAEQDGTLTGFVTFEVQHRCKDGRLIWGEVLSKPERDMRGSITGYHGITREITERKQMQDQVRQLAFYDPLTRLPNRRLLNDRLSQTMAASKRSGCYGALMFLDLDNFKALNDTHGHVVGDLLLMEAAGRMKDCVREVDTVARFGGDEFVVLLNDLDTDSAKSTSRCRIVAEKIRRALSEPYLLTIEREGEADTIVEHRCSASIGVALLINHEATQDDILKWADKAMYLAKEAGRNQVCFYASKPDVQDDHNR